MNKSNLGITAGWMSWDEIEPFKKQLIELEQVLLVKYHYPDRYDGKLYCEKRVNMLEQYLANGNTYFWGAVHEQTLVGYYWAYTTQFIDKKRWCLSSLMIRDEYRKLGLGTLAIKEGLKMAKAVGCDEASTHYVPWNEAAAKAYQKAGYEITRIEIVKRLDKDNN